MKNKEGSLSCRNGGTRLLKCEGGIVFRSTVSQSEEKRKSEGCWILSCSCRKKTKSRNLSEKENLRYVSHFLIRNKIRFAH